VETKVLNFSEIRDDTIGLCPAGTPDNSPAFQRRAETIKTISPAGTAEVERIISRPFGTRLLRGTNPALKRRAILECPAGT
jgi:hypothetical protein